MNDIIQDRRGFLWFATEDGLNRYDGYNSTVFKYNPFDSSSISSNYVSCLLLDENGVLWVGTQTGLNAFDSEKETFQRYRLFPAAKDRPYANHIVSMTIDRKGMMWLAAFDNGLCRFDRGSGKSQLYKHDSSNPNSLVTDSLWRVYEDTSGSLWVGTRGGLEKYDHQRNGFVHLKGKPGTPENMIFRTVSAMLEENTEKMWLGTQGRGLSEFDWKTKKLRTYDLPPNGRSSKSWNWVTALHEDNNGRLWLGTLFDGIWLFDRSANRWTQFTFDPGNSKSLSGSTVWSMYEDRAGILWVGTANGVSKYNPRKSKFSVFRNDRDNPMSIAHNDVHAVIEDKSGFLWVGMDAADPDIGLSRIDRRSGRYIHFRGDRSDPRTIHPRVWALCEDHQGVIWIGTFGGGLYRLDPGSMRIRNYRNDPTNARSLAGDLVRCVYEDNSGCLWIGNEGKGLNRFDPRTGTFKRYVHESGKANSLSHNNVSVIYEDHTRTLWIGTGAGGLNRFDRATESFVSYKHDAKDSSSLSNDGVLALCEDQQGNFWVGTIAGLNRFDLQRGKFSVYTERDGLASSFIYGILADDEGMLWLSTNRGISKFDGRLPAGRQFRNYSVVDGVQGYEFNRGGYYKSRKGEMFFAGRNGFNCFYPSYVHDDAMMPPIVLTSFSILHKPAKLDRALAEVKEIELTYMQDVFSFEFAALNFTNPEKNQYAYIMEGFDREWTYAGTRRFLTYTHLSPGTYVLRVKASNSDGVWNEAGTSIRIMIAPPFWDTWWFRALIGLSLVGVVIVLYNLRVNRLLAIERTRDRIARDLHDDVASTLGSVAFYVESLRRRLGKAPRATQELLGKISSLSLEAVDSMGDIVWSVSPQHDTMSDLLVHIRDLASQTCTAAGIEYEIKIVKAVEDLQINVEIRKSVYLIFKEALNNILKHSNASSVVISAGVTKGVFEMTVHDNGQGFLIRGTSGDGGKEMPSRGHGLRSMAKRASEIEAQFSVTSKRGDGTTVFLSKKMT